MYGIRQYKRIFPAVRLVHSLLKYFFFYISVVILNSSLHYQIFEFDINIQILVWIIGSTYRKGEIFSLLHEIHNGVGVGLMGCFGVYVVLTGRLPCTPRNSHVHPVTLATANTVIRRRGPFCPRLRIVQNE